MHHAGFRIPTDASARIPAVARTFRDDLDNLARKASGLIFHVDTPSTQQLCFRWGVVQCSMSPVTASCSFCFQAFQRPGWSFRRTLYPLRREGGDFKCAT